MQSSGSRLGRHPLHQLTAYALALASRLRLPLKDFICAWFDDRHYYEFFPLHAVYELRKRPFARDAGF